MSFLAELEFEPGSPCFWMDTLTNIAIVALISQKHFCSYLCSLCKSWTKGGFHIRNVLQRLRNTDETERLQHQIKQNRLQQIPMKAFSVHCSNIQQFSRSPTGSFLFNGLAFNRFLHCLLQGQSTKDRIQIRRACSCLPVFC